MDEAQNAASVEERIGELLAGLDDAQRMRVYDFESASRRGAQSKAWTRGAVDAAQGLLHAWADGDDFKIFEAIRAVQKAVREPSDAE